MDIQNLFQDALEHVSNETKWAMIWEPCEPHEDRPPVRGTVAGVPITYQREVGLPGVTDHAIQQAFRIHFYALDFAITGNPYVGGYKLEKDADGNARLVIEKAVPHCKRVVSCLTPKDTWIDTTHLFSLRDPLSQMGFDVFKHEGEDIQTPYRITAAWGVEA